MATDVRGTSLGSKIEAISGKWGWFVAAGIALVIFGMIALGNLLQATEAVIFVTGIMLMVAGVVQIAHAFGATGWGKVIYWVLSGLLYVAAGAVALMNPMIAAAVFTLLLAATVFALGVVRIVAGFDAKPAQGWGWVVAGGVLTLLFGVLIGIGWPINSLWLIGMLLGIDLIFQGVAWVAFGFALRRRA